MKILRLFLFFLLSVLLIFVVLNRTVLTLDWAPATPQGPEAYPPVLQPVAPAGEGTTLQWWEAFQRPAIKAALQREIYGTLPDRSETHVIERRIVSDDAFGGLGQYDEIRFTAEAYFGDAQGGGEVTMALVLPRTPGPHPVIFMETFCPRWVTAPHQDASRPAGASIEAPSGLIWYVFGRYNCTPPIQEILARGYGLAVINATQLVPDRAEAGLSALTAMASSGADEPTRWGAIAAWAWLYSGMADAIADDPRVDAQAFITYGHSRYGKSALLAAAFDRRFAAVIAHQSGTGGAALNRQKKGESIKAITASYPHWFAPAYADVAGRADALTVDQHHLLALVAPRPVLLGNARRDVWSDPNGSFKAAQGAAPAYGLYGVDDIPLARLDEFTPSAAIAFWMRPGTHGTVEEDWPAFLAFLDAHFAKAPE